MDLHNCNTRDYNDIGELFEGEVQLESGSLSSKQKIFPLAVDDYFMAVALLSQRLSDQKVYTEGAFSIYKHLALALALFAREFWPGTRIPTGPLSHAPLLH